MKTRSILTLAVIFSSLFIFTSCQKEELTDELYSSQSVITETEGISSAALPNGSQSMTLELTNNVQFQSNNQGFLSLTIRGTGFVSGSYGGATNLAQQAVYNDESRMVEASSSSSSGNGTLYFPGQGTLIYTTSCSDYPMPSNGALHNWDMDIEIVGGSGHFAGISASGNYHVQQLPRGGQVERVTIVFN